MRALRTVVSHAALAAAIPALAAAWGATLRADDNNAMQIKVAPITVAPGEMAEAVVTIDIGKDYRILGEPPPNKYSTTLMVTFDATRSLQPREAIIPEPKTFTESPQPFTYHAYDGTIVVKMPFKADEHAAPGDHTLHGRVRYQALIIDDDGLAGFLKTTVKLVDATVHVVPRKK
jgi:DsbC/DsbD-like thiol-disulfide interchange protein